MTTWSFSGSAPVGVDLVTIADDDGGVSRGWNVGPAFYAGTNTNIDFISGTASFTHGATTYSILGVGAEVSDPTDPFGIAINVASLDSSDDFAVGSVPQFSGSATAPVDISAFAQGTTTALNGMASLSDPQGTFPVTFRVGNPATVPSVPACA